MNFCSRLIKSFKKVLILLITMGLIFSLIFFSNANTFAFFDTQYKPMPSINFSALQGVQINITPSLLNALIYVESSNNPAAFNRFSHATGLTQIRYIAWKELAKHYKGKYKESRYRKDMLNPYIARQAGKDYLCILQKHLKAKKIPLTMDNLLAAYVWGETNLSRYGLKRAPRSVKRYIANVKKLNQPSN